MKPDDATLSAALEAERYAKWAEEQALLWDAPLALARSGRPVPAHVFVKLGEGVQQNYRYVGGLLVFRATLKEQGAGVPTALPRPWWAFWRP